MTDCVVSALEHSFRQTSTARIRAADDYKAIAARQEALKAGRAGVHDYVDRTTPSGTLVSCSHPGCGRTTEAAAHSPCTGACGLPPGARAGQGPEWNGWC